MPDSKKYIFPERCPSCGSKTVKDFNESTKKYDAVRRCPNEDFKCEKIIITSTSEVYGTAIYVPLDENHPLQAQSPYSATKIAADRLSESFRKSYELPVIIVRPFN